MGGGGGARVQNGSMPLYWLCIQLYNAPKCKHKLNHVDGYGVKLALF